MCVCVPLVDEVQQLCHQNICTLVVHLFVCVRNVCVCVRVMCVCVCVSLGGEEKQLCHLHIRTLIVHLFVCVCVRNVCVCARARAPLVGKVKQLRHATSTFAYSSFTCLCMCRV